MNAESHIISAYNHERTIAQTVPWLLIAAIGIAWVLLRPILQEDATKWVSAMVLSAVAAWSDLLKRRVPNGITYPGIVVALWIAVFDSETQSTAGILQCMTACLIVGLVARSICGLGGGDVKLLVALSGILGSTQMTVIVWYFALIAGLIALLHLATGRRFIGYLRCLLISVWYPRCWSIARLRPTRYIPLAPALFIAVTVRWYQIASAP